eukprot:4724201-Heterocapsa_arctica.AAC.1
MEFRLHFVYIQALLGQYCMNCARNPNDRLRHMGCYIDNIKEQNEFKLKLRKTHHIIGEASNPGPDGNIVKQ